MHTSCPYSSMYIPGSRGVEGGNNRVYLVLYSFSRILTFEYVSNQVPVSVLIFFE